MNNGQKAKIVSYRNYKDINIEFEDGTIKKTNVVIWILTGIFVLTVIAILSIIFIVPIFTKVPDIKIPDVSDMTVIEAEEKLKKLGFDVAIETKKEESEKYEKGDVIKTSPQAGRSVKQGTTITIYESLGKEIYVVEDYTGQNYIEVETLLEKMYGIKVNVEKKDVDDTDNYEKQEIIGQSVEKGTELAAGKEIILYIPNIEDIYPNMVEDGWTVDDVKAFCEKYEITLKIDYQSTSEYVEGTLISQSRSPKTPIVSGSTLKIVVAQAPNENASGELKEDDNSDSSSSDSEASSSDSLKQ